MSQDMIQFHPGLRVIFRTFSQLAQIIYNVDLAKSIMNVH